MTTDIDPATEPAFSAFAFELIGRFRDVAVDNHMGVGESLEDVTAHETGLVEGSQLLNHYDPPVVFTVFTSMDDAAHTTRARQTTLNMDVAAFNWNYDANYGFEDTLRVMFRVIGNVEANKTLQSSPGAGDPLATEVTWSDLEADYRFNDSSGVYIHWASASFTIEAKRRRP